MTVSDIEYYSRRERQEREHAERTADHGARLVHLELASRYSQLLQSVAVISPAQPMA